MDVQGFQKHKVPFSHRKNALNTHVLLSAPYESRSNPDPIQKLVLKGGDHLVFMVKG